MGRLKAGKRNTGKNPPYYLDGYEVEMSATFRITWFYIE